MNSIFFVVLSILLFARAIADEAAYFHPLTNMPDSSDDIETSFYFPEQSDLKFGSGDMITVLCHFTNDGISPLNVSGIMGSLNSPYDFGQYIQNFSFKPVGLVVKAGEEMTFEYQFQVHPSLPASEYQVAHTIFYNSEMEGFSTTFFNNTIEVYLPPQVTDIQTVFSVLFGFLSTVFVVIVTLALCWPEFANKNLSFLFESNNPVKPTIKASKEENWVPEKVVYSGGKKNGKGKTKKSE